MYQPTPSTDRMFTLLVCQIPFDKTSVSAINRLQLIKCHTDVLSKGIWQTVRELQDPELKQWKIVLSSSTCILSVEGVG